MVVSGIVSSSIFVMVFVKKQTLSLTSRTWDTEFQSSRFSFNPSTASTELYLIAADRREAAHYSCDSNIVTRAQVSMPSYV